MDKSRQLSQFERWSITRDLSKVTKTSKRMEEIEKEAVKELYDVLMNQVPVELLEYKGFLNRINQVKLNDGAIGGHSHIFYFEESVYIPSESKDENDIIYKNSIPFQSFSKYPKLYSLLEELFELKGRYDTEFLKIRGAMDNLNTTARLLVELPEIREVRYFHPLVGSHGYIAEPLQRERIKRSAELIRSYL